MVNHKPCHQTLGSSSHVQCPYCAAMNEATVHNEDQTLLLATDTPISLTVTIPVWTCTLCQESWTDYAAEAIRDHAVREFL